MAVSALGVMKAAAPAVRGALSAAYNSPVGKTLRNVKGRNSHKITS